MSKSNEEERNFYLSQILPSLIKDISPSDRKRIFKTEYNSKEYKDVRIFSYKGRNQQYPIRTSANTRPETAFSIPKPWIENAHQSTFIGTLSCLIDRNQLEISEDDVIKTETDRNHLKTPTEDGFEDTDGCLMTKSVNHPHGAMAVVSVGPKIMKTKRLRPVTVANTKSRPPLHWPKYAVSKTGHIGDQALLAGPIPPSTIKEFKKPTFIERKIVDSLIGIPIDIFERLSLKLEQQEVADSVYIKNLHKITRIKTEKQFGKWIISQNKQSC